MKPFTRDEIVLQLRSRGVPLDKAEAAADAHTLTPAKVAAMKRGPRRAPKRGPRAPSLEAKTFLLLLEREGLPRPTPEYRFLPPRKWRFDFAWPTQFVALEVEGGVWTQGRHTRGKGFLADVEKYNAATAWGWRLLRTTPSALCLAETITSLRTLLTESA